MSLSLPERFCREVRLETAEAVAALIEGGRIVLGRVREGRPEIAFAGDPEAVGLVRLWLLTTGPIEVRPGFTVVVVA